MKIAIALFATATVACISGNASMDLRSVEDATFAPPPGAATAARSSTESDVTLDLHADLESFAAVGKLDVRITTDALAGADLAFVDTVTETIASSDGAMPAQLLAQAVVAAGSTETDLVPALTDDQILAYLREGPATVHVEVTGALPARPLTLTYTLGAHVEIAVDSSIAKL